MSTRKDIRNVEALAAQQLLGRGSLCATRAPAAQACDRRTDGVRVVGSATPVTLGDAVVGAPLTRADWVAMPQARRTNVCLMIIERGFRSAEEARESATFALRLAALEYGLVE